MVSLQENILWDARTPGFLLYLTFAGNMLFIVRKEILQLKIFFDKSLREQISCLLSSNIMNMWNFIL